MDSPFPGTPYSTQPHTNINKITDLTPEEIRILKECNKEAITTRAMPIGLTFGLLSHFASKSLGKLSHRKYGTVPIVLASGVFGYLVGRISYIPVCAERLMNVPGGVYRQRALAVQDLPLGSYGQISPTRQVPQVGQMDPRTYIQSRPSDIDLPTMSNFDTMPSNLDSEALPGSGRPVIDTTQRYTSYDELRERNRREYMEKMQHGYGPQTHSGYGQASGLGQLPSIDSIDQNNIENYPSGYQQQPMPPRQPIYQRPHAPVQPVYPEITQDTGPIPRKSRTKYGDEWEF